MWSLDSFAEVSAWSLSHPSLTSGLSLKPPCHISVILTVFQIFTLFFMVIFGVRYHEVWVSLAAQLVKNLPAMQEAWVGMPVRAPKTPRGECPPGTELAEGQGRGAPERLWQERRRVPSERSIRVGEPIASTIPGAAQEGSRGWGRAHKQELRPGWTGLWNWVSKVGGPPRWPKGLRVACNGRVLEGGGGCYRLEVCAP